MPAIYERYRPANYADMVGQERALAALDCVRSANGGSLGGQCFWLAAGSGTGKTTLARLIANEVAGEDGHVTETVAGRLAPSDVDAWRDSCRLAPMFGTGHALIVDEAHLLSKPVIGRLLKALEPLPSNTVVVFTTTREGDDAVLDKLDGGPLFSRFKRLPLAIRGLAEAFARRLQAICEREGLGGAKYENYLRCVKDLRNNFRAALQEAEIGTFKQ